MIPVQLRYFIQKLDNEIGAKFKEGKDEDAFQYFLDYDTRLPIK